jgi:hypothetical protein
MVFVAVRGVATTGAQVKPERQSRKLKVESRNGNPDFSFQISVFRFFFYAVRMGIIT